MVLFARRPPGPPRHPLSNVQRVTNLATVSNKFIVEVADASDIPSKRALSTHEQLYQALRERKISFEVNKEYDAPGLFVGAALTLTDTQDVANILNTEGVVAIRPVRTYGRPVPVSSKKVSPGDAGLPDSESTHITTGVSKLHSQGITGKGVKIGILDTGTDYTHPSLGGGFGPGFKVAGGFDLVGDNYDGSNTPVPDPDPLDQCAGHGSYYNLPTSPLFIRQFFWAGTHVAGIIGANPGNEFNISGVAYDASLYSYRIFGCTGIIVDGLIMGVQAGMDILTMSLGGSDGWTEGTGTVVSSRIAASGKVVTIAAGNDGASGAFFTSGPGNAIDAISVASSDNTVIPLQSLTVSGATHDPIVYYDVRLNNLYCSLRGSDHQVNTDVPSAGERDSTSVLLPRTTLLSLTTHATLCPTLPRTWPDSSSSFAGELAPFNGNGFSAISVGDFNAVLIQADDGVFLAEQYAAGAPIAVTFPQTGGGVQFPAPTGGLVSTFTTYGPTNDFYFKPAITAPGGNILSTLPVPLGSWGLESGTSMATPFMAGSSALLLSVKGRTPAVAKSARGLFQATAATIGSTLTDGDPLQTATQQGAGLVQVFDAIFGTTLLSKTELILNDTAHFAGPQKFTVTNTGKTAKVYTLSHTPAGTVVTDDAGSIQPNLGPVPLTTDFATVTFSGGNKFTLAPGQSHEVTANIKPPQGVDATTFPVYSGFIHVTSGNDSVHATYLGLAASLKDKQVIDNTDFIFGFTLPLILDASGNPQNASVNYTFVGTDAPTILWRQAFGTPVLRLDLVPANTTFTGTLNARGNGEPNSFATPHKGGSFAKVPVLGTLLEIDWLSRNDEINLLDNTLLLENAFANGTTIPNGSYKVLLRSLRVTGDATNEADYESWLSPIIGVAA
ncbi:subtilisin-like protease [Mycena metata]|uniref:Subtilisin-like protease n=1 Tax=Mycena metata TaxID=1033252 RepID=A0AAD7HLT4_9AGAR|nr:subtilisin-like protease [Mycena metata]